MQSTETVDTGNMSILGSYSYKNLKPNAFIFEDTANHTTYYFQIFPINNNVAAIQFCSDDTMQDSIGIPAGFALDEVGQGPVAVAFQSYFITWIADYSLRFNGVEIWSVTNQKQQSINKVGNVDIVSYNLYKGVK